jgi:4-amino-4-deoxy-L-arabinose transferase-like glycosyltransferase
LREKIFWSRPIKILSLLIIIALGIGIRLYDLFDPPLDFFATRQLRSAIIARSFYYQFSEDTDPNLNQKAIELGQLESYEPPILESVVGFTNSIIGDDYFWVGRIYNTLFWAIGGLAIYFLTRRFMMFPAILAGLALYFFLPFSVIASRSFQPDPGMVMWIILSALALFRWSETKSWKWVIIAGITGGIAILVKVMAGFFVMSMLAAITLTMIGIKRLFKNPQPWIIGILMLVPALIFYLLLTPQRSGDLFTFWTLGLNRMVTTTEFYADWLAMIKGIISFPMFVAALLGTLLFEKKIRAIMIGGWIGYGLFGLAFPYHFTTHDYYHLTLIPLTAISIIPVINLIFIALKKQAFVWRLAAALILIFASFYSIYVSRSILYAANYSLEPASWKRVGDAIPEDSKFIALTTDYGKRLGYYGWRYPTIEWPSTGDLRLSSLSGNDPLDYDKYFENITAGMDYFLVTAYPQLDAQPQLKEILTDQYPVYSEGNGFIIYDLTNPLK